MRDLPLLTILLPPKASPIMGILSFHPLPLLGCIGHLAEAGSPRGFSLWCRYASQLLHSFTKGTYNSGLVQLIGLFLDRCVSLQQLARWKDLKSSFNAIPNASLLNYLLISLPILDLPSLLLSLYSMTKHDETQHNGHNISVCALESYI
jgi:hypothetical protein